ncbi:M protein trans-acting positive regulator, partial [Enterococcus faecalis]|nr:M protein trans-acting positive regulator [Enterococcus faecalis]
PSYLNILTQKLNEFFSGFDFRITVREGYYTLVGDEMNIRLFSYLYLQDSFHDLEWPFPDISLHSIRASVPEEILEESYKRSFT